MTMKETPTTVAIIMMVINATTPMKEVEVAMMALGDHNHERNTNSNDNDIRQP